jgi:hypothetical protein
MTSERKTKVAGVAFIVIAALMTLTILCDQCGKKHVQAPGDQAKIDSLKKENEKLQTQALMLRREVFAKVYEVDSLKARKNDVVVRYKTLREESTDTLFVYIADSLNEINNEIIDTLEHGLNTCQHVIRLQDEQIKNDSIAMVEYTDIIKYQTATITRLGEKTWWDRNKLWVGIVGGIIIGGAGVAAVR